MSHSAVIVLAETYKEVLHRCEATLNSLIELETSIKIGKTADKVITSAKRELINFRDELRTKKVTIDTDHLNELNQKISSSMKRIMGFKNQIDFVKNMEETNITSDQEISKIIFEHGYIARVVIDEINSNNEELSARNILSKIGNAALQEQEDKVKQEFMKKVTDSISKTRFNQDIKFSFYKIASNMKSGQEFNDFIALLESKVQEADNMINIIEKELIPAADAVDLETTKEIEFILNNKNELSALVYFEDYEMGTLTMELNEVQQIKYKMGDYEGHLCHTKANKIWEQVGDNRIILKRSIIRDFTDETKIHSMAKAIEIGRGK